MPIISMVSLTKTGLTALIREMTLAGLGISLLPDFFVEKDVREGQLVSLLEDDLPGPIGIYAVYPPRRQISPAARAFVEHLTRELGQAGGSASGVAQ